MHSRSITHSRVSSHFPGHESDPISAPRHRLCLLVTPSPHDAEQGSQLDQLAQPAVSTQASFIAAATLLAVFGSLYALLIRTANRSLGPDASWLRAPIGMSLPIPTAITAM